MDPEEQEWKSSSDEEEDTTRWREGLLGSSGTVWSDSGLTSWASSRLKESAASSMDTIESRDIAEVDCSDTTESRDIAEMDCSDTIESRDIELLRQLLYPLERLELMLRDESRRLCLNASFVLIFSVSLASSDTSVHRPLSAKRSRRCTGSVLLSSLSVSC